MRVPIKFRGKRLDNGKYVYGDLIHYHKNVYIRFKDIDAPMEYFHVEVFPDFVSQLVGYDVDDEEVYEGDEIQDLATGDVITAKLCPCNSYDVGITTAYFEKVGNNND